MIVRSHLPWPLRWAVAAVVLGFSAAIALWAFEFGREFAGLDRGAKSELARLNGELDRLRGESERTRELSNAAQSLLKTERVAQERLAQQLVQVEAEKQTLLADLAFYERLLPTSGDGLQLRGLQAQAKAPGQLRYQMLVVQNGKGAATFNGQYALELSGLLGGKAWAMSLPGGPRALQVHRVARLDGLIEHPLEAVIKSMQVRVVDAQGITRAAQSVKL